MERTYSDQPEDIVAGKVKRGTKKDGTEAKFFNLYIFELDRKTKQPKVIGEWKGKDGKMYPKYRIITVLRVAESSFLKVATGKQTMCNIYLKLGR